MKECLYCKKEFEGKKPTRKFCSDSCRVMYNRKFGGKALKDWQAKSIYNSIIEGIEKLTNIKVEKGSIIIPQNNDSTQVHNFPTNQQPLDKVGILYQVIDECETLNDFKSALKDIDNAKLPYQIRGKLLEYWDKIKNKKGFIYNDIN
jgi:hypothetical protein